MLFEFDRELQENNHLEYQKLQPPLSEIEIRRHLRTVALDDTDLLDLYMWKNGARSEHSCRIIKEGVFLPLEEFVNNVQDDENDYDPALFTLVDDVEEKFLINAKRDSVHFGKIYLYSIPALYIDFPISIYDSGAALIETNTLAYKKGICKYDLSTRSMTCNNKRFKELAREINKQSMYWKEHDPLNEEEWYEI